MKIYLLNIESRKGDRNVHEIFSTFEKAKEYLRKRFYWIDEIENYTEFGSNFNEGQIYTEEESAEILVKEIE